MTSFICGVETDLLHIQDITPTFTLEPEAVLLHRNIDTGPQAHNRPQPATRRCTLTTVVLSNTNMFTEHIDVEHKTV